MTNDTSFTKALATRAITWRTITPYAPWQGAFYERLIKSVKHSLYKVLQKTIPATLQLTTLLVEIEGCLNNRPLTYIEEKPDDLVILRPIDFIQRDIILTYPLESTSLQKDEDYIPPYELGLLRTRLHKLTEQYWTIWSQEYLKSLRETHVLSFDKKRSTTIPPTIGTVVLIYEPVLLRNTWRMSRIVKLQPSESGAIREAHVKLPNGRIIRRPVNLLIPLELGNTQPNESPSVDDGTNTAPGHDINNEDMLDEKSRERYNLRPRPYTRTVHSVQSSESNDEHLIMTITNMQRALLFTSSNNF
ncbi:unnamed protein product [Angiostrongylus costaricensis]|uniref:DUF5641 domain-containing protein n=1 Tax=Angiostrongylus costaricensis TaxID=334426 RepID=A0A0R3Q2U0_ANGCS|nr:unnamed protein product [Angiostrongylus costaricensis]